MFHLSINDVIKSLFIFEIRQQSQNVEMFQKNPCKVKVKRGVVLFVNSVGDSIHINENNGYI